MSMRYGIAFYLLAAACLGKAAEAQTFDAAAAFGARPTVAQLSMSPDGNRVAFLAPTPGQGNALVILALEKDAKPRSVLAADGKPDRLTGCNWVANNRLICSVHGVIKTPQLGNVPRTRLIAVDSDGGNIKILSTEESQYARSFSTGGGSIIDWLPDEDGSVLMARTYFPDVHAGSQIGSRDKGLGVDQIDTRSLAITHVEPADPAASLYLTDGRGNVRIKAIFDAGDTRVQTPLLHYYYRLADSREWRKLGDYNTQTHEGFQPRAVDHDLNVVYGMKSYEGHSALYSISLDGAAHEQLIYANPQADVDSLFRIGHRQHVVGASYATTVRRSVYFSEEVKQMLESLAKALPGKELRIVDSSTDESRMLIFAGSDIDPGVYYIFDRPSHKLQTFLVTRDPLEGVKLARERPIAYPSGDGVMIPAYLTLPPGHEDAKGLPAIVLPHGGPSSRDEWGFDWLPQYFANRGFAVLQPEFRGSAGYGDAWFEQNGFHSWRIAIGDVLSAGHWLVSQGVDPAKLGVVGWSYGGYAALQSAVVEPATFKAVIAIAPVTDLSALEDEFKRYNNFEAIKAMVGVGLHVQEGSPIEHTDAIKAPVLLFHGTADTNVNVEESIRMCDKLKAVGGHCDLTTWDGLDHQLEDSAARTEMLRKSDAFLSKTFGMPAQ